MYSESIPKIVLISIFLTFEVLKQSVFFKQSLAFNLLLYFILKNKYHQLISVALT